MSTFHARKADFHAVKRLARQVLEENGIFKPPVIAAELAESYGLEVFESEFNEEYAHIAGFIDFGENFILVNADDSLHRKNFTVAHELGHYLLGHNAENGYTVLLRDPDAMVKTPLEQEANCFAANVLVPEPFLLEYLDNYPYITNQQLSKAFGVSADVVRIRRLYLK